MTTKGTTITPSRKRVLVAVNIVIALELPPPRLGNDPNN
jgi:hypothetical protein